MKKVYIDTEFITLTQFLKMENYISSGGEAKYFLLDTKVFLNLEIETRRGKKLYNNDKLKIGTEEYIILNET